MKDPFNDLFPIKSASEWIEESKKKPIPKKIFDEFWYEGELCILFADTNVGKSILAVQIANSISKGETIDDLVVEIQKQPVLYYDFELTEKQFENRYSRDYSNHYEWDENFKRVQLNPSADIPTPFTFDSFLSVAIEKAIVTHGIKVIILDNLTYLTSNGGNAREALATMKNLNKWKIKYGLSILVLAHTPKRNPTKPITSNDLLGSKNLMNFCDSAFTIGQSNRDNNLKYLKQIKQRNSSQIFSSENVWICEIVKPESFLKFQFVEYGSEAEHLKVQKAEDVERLAIEVLTLHLEGKSLREIGRSLGISHMKASRILKANPEECNVTLQPIQPQINTTPLIEK
ncbi:AAA family ATPase [Algoriphagus aquimarinus]|uniref:AAA family ATPase n=1 Tax=Algoriphagus aquimarinus TaxID=237018 RepID=UPI0030DAA137